MRQKDICNPICIIIAGITTLPLSHQFPPAGFQQRSNENLNKLFDDALNLKFKPSTFNMYRINNFKCFYSIVFSTTGLSGATRHMIWLRGCQMRCKVMKYQKKVLYQLYKCSPLQPPIFPALSKSDGPLQRTVVLGLTRERRPVPSYPLSCPCRVPRVVKIIKILMFPRQI